MAEQAKPWERYQAAPVAQAAPVSAPKPWEKFQQAGQKAGPRQYAESMLGPAEGALQMASSTVAEPVSGLIGLLSGLVPGAPKGGDVVKGVQDAMTYQPRTEQGQKFMPDLVESILDATPEMIKRPAAGAAKKYSEFEGWLADHYGPEAATAAATLPTALLEAIPAGLAVRKMRQAKLPAPAQFAPPAATPATPAVSPMEVTPSTRQYQEVAGALRAGDTKKVAPMVNPDMQILEDARALGIDLNPSSYSTNRAYIDMEQALKSRPGSLLNATEEKSILDLGNRADQLIADLGGAPDKSILDVGLKSEFDSTMGTLETLSDSLYKKIDDTIPKATRVNPTTTRAFVEGQLKDLGNDESVLTSAEKRLRALVTDKDANGKVVEKTPTYAALDRVRRDIGAAIGKKSGPFKDDDVGQLKNIYAELLEDQQRFAEAFGVGDDYKDASGLVKLRKGIEDKAVALFGKEVNGSIIPKLKQSAAALTRGDVSTLEKMMEAVPEARRGEVAANMLNDLFTSGMRGSAPIGQGFAKAFEGLNRNAGAKAALFKYLPEGAQERFNTIGRVATGIYRAKALENTSRSARDVIASMDDAGMLSKIYGVGKKVAVAEGVSSAIGIPGAGTAGVVGSILSKGATPATKAADELLTSPAFKESIIKAAQGQNGKQSVVMNTPAYDKWLKTQNPSVKAEIAAIGFIPWLTSSSGKETKSPAQAAPRPGSGSRQSMQP